MAALPDFPAPFRQQFDAARDPHAARNALGVQPGVALDAAGNVVAGAVHVAFAETGDPAAPAAGGALLYARDNGAGKTQLCVRFALGAIQVLATEP